MEETLVKLKRQIEFYFSDANLNKDKFMRDKLSEGPVPISIIASFNRIKSIQSDGIPEMIKESLKESELVEIVDECIKRKVEYKPMSKEDVNDLTVYVSKIPKTASLDDIIKFFNEFAKVSIVRRKIKDDEFSGVAYVQFESKEDVEKVLALHDVKYEQETLEMKPFKAFAKKGSKEVAPVEFIGGCLVKVQIVGDCNDCQTKIGAQFEEFGVESVHFDQDKKEAIVQFSSPVANSIIDKYGASLTLHEGPNGEKEYGMNLEVISGEDEKAYYQSKVKPEPKNNKRKPKSKHELEVERIESFEFFPDQFVSFELNFGDADESQREEVKQLENIKNFFSQFGKAFVKLEDSGDKGFARFTNEHISEEILAKICEGTFANGAIGIKAQFMDETEAKENFEEMKKKLISKSEYKNQTKKPFKKRRY